MTQFHLDAVDLLEIEDRRDFERLAPFLSHLARACPTCRLALQQADLLPESKGRTSVAAGSHVTDETFRAWLRKEDDSLAQRILLHGAECCGSCGPEVRAVAALRAAGELDQDGWATESEAILALSRLRAPALAEELAALEPAAASKAVAEQDRFDSWGLVELLCTQSLAAASADPDQALTLADLALAIAERATLPDLPEDCRQELRMLAHAHRGNALRAAVELRAATAEFERAEKCWRRAQVRRFPYRAEALTLRMSLERYRRDYAACLETGDKALGEASTEFETYPALKARILVKKALVLGELDRSSEAVEAAAEAAAHAHRKTQPGLWLAAVQVQLFFLPEVSRYAEAEALLAPVAEHARRHGSPADQLRVQWAEARVRAALGRIDRAVELLRSVRRGFLDMDQAPTAAVASLELATLYFQQDRLQQVRGLALEMLPVFQEKGIHREAMAALAIFQQAAITETVTERLLTDLVAYFRKAQSNPTLRFKEPR